MRLGIGSIIPLSRVVFFNMNVGISFGEMKSRMLNKSDTIKNNTVFRLNGEFRKVHISPALNIIPSNNFKINTSLRFVFLKYQDFQTNYPYKISNVLELSRFMNNTRLLMEPSIFFQVGAPKIEWVKFDAGITYSIRIWDSEKEIVHLQSRFFQFSSGVTLYPSLIFKSRKK